MPKTTRDGSRGTVTRREVCVHACQFVSLATIGSLLQGCDGGGPTSPSGNVPPLPVINTTASGGAITLQIDAASPLANVGGAALVRASGNEILVARTGPTSVSAVTAICTHESCTITGFEGQRFVCPCHGSRYSIDGAVVNGPATRALRTFGATLAGSTLTVSL